MSKSKLVFIENVKGVNKVNDMILLESPDLNIETTLANFNSEGKTPSFMDLSMICVKGSM